MNNKPYACINWGNRLHKIYEVISMADAFPFVDCWLFCLAKDFEAFYFDWLKVSEHWLDFPFFITIPYGVMLLLSSNAKSIMIHTVRLKVFLFVQTNKKHDIDNLFNSMPNLYAFFFIIINEHFYLIFDRNIFRL